jgi:hypothetical protein
MIFDKIPVFRDWAFDRNALMCACKAWVRVFTNLLLLHSCIAIFNALISGCFFSTTQKYYTDAQLAAYDAMCEFVFDGPDGSYGTGAYQ